MDPNELIQMLQRLLSGAQGPGMQQEPTIGAPSGVQTQVTPAVAPPQAMEPKMPTVPSGPSRYDEDEANAVARRDETRSNLLATYDKKLPETPKATNPALRTQDLLTGLLPALLIGMFDKHGQGVKAFGEGFLKGKELKASQDTQVSRDDYNRKLQEYEIGQQKAGLENKFAEQDANYAQGQSADFRKQQAQEAKDYASQGKALRAQYFASNMPGEKQTAARILREQYPEYAPAPEEETRDIEVLSQPEAKAFNERLRKFKDAAYFETDKEMAESLDEYRRHRSDLIGHGIPERLLDPVLDVKSVKQFRAEAAKEAKDKQLTLARERFNFDKGFKEKSLKQRLEVSWANYHLARDNYALAAQRNQMGYMKMYAGAMSTNAKAAADVIKKRIQETSKEISQRVGALKKDGLSADEIDKDPQVQALRTLINGSPAMELWGQTKEEVKGYLQQLDDLNQGLTEAGLPEEMDNTLYGSDERAVQGTNKPYNKAAGKSPYQGIVTKAAKNYGIPASFLDAILRAESGYNPKAVSPKGAAGVAQFMPGTAKQYGIDPFNPSQAIPAAAKHLAGLLAKYRGNIDLAAAAYNAGGGAVDKYNGVPPYKETQGYVRRIAQLMGRDAPAMPRLRATGGHRQNNSQKKPIGSGGHVKPGQTKQLGGGVTVTRID